MHGYKFVKDKFDELGIIGRIYEILSWDAAVIMKHQSSDARGEQLAYLHKRQHQIMIDKNLKEHIDIALVANLNPWEKANIELINHEVLNASVLPESLVSELAITSNKCEMVWRGAKANNDFKQVEPYLKELVDLTIQKAELKGQCFGINPYDALIDDYDRGRTTKELDALFSDLKVFLIEFAPRVIANQRSVNFREGRVDLANQKQIFEKYLSMLNFNFEAGRLDASAHPFCGGTPDDSRITTWFNEDTFLSNIYGTIHEGGHSLYERNLPKEWRLQPVGKACGFAIHESQSLFIEKQVGMHRNFIKNLYKDMHESFGFNSVSEQEFEDAVSTINSSFIRVNADEVTYPLHVIMRYEIEKDLIGKKLKVEDLPERWNADMKTMLGITPPTDTLGCMQDIHWYSGHFGYFSAYTVGALTAAQIMDKIKRDIKDVDDLIAKRDLGPILTWLNNNIHAYGSKLKPRELIENSTGSPLNAKYFKDYLHNRYL